MITVSPINGVLSRMSSLSRAMDDVTGRSDEYANGNGQYFTPAMDAWETEQAFVVQFTQSPFWIHSATGDPSVRPWRTPPVISAASCSIFMRPPRP